MRRALFFVVVASLSFACARSIDAGREVVAPPAIIPDAGRATVTALDAGASTDAAAKEPPGEALVVWRADSRAVFVARGRHGILVGLDGEAVHVDDPREALEAAAFSPDGGVLATVGSGGLVALRASSTGALLGELPRAVVDADARAGVDRPGVVFSHDGRRVAAWVDHLRVWRVDTRAPVCTVLEPWTFDAHGATRLHPSPDSSLFVGVTADEVHLWRTGTGELARTVPAPP